MRLKKHAKLEMLVALGAHVNLSHLTGRTQPESLINRSLPTVPGVGVILSALGLVLRYLTIQESNGVLQ